MTPYPLTPDFLRLAKRIVWFEEPETALAEPIRFTAYALRYATAEDMRLVLSHIGQDGLRDALDEAPPGIIDPRSWAYWNTMVGRYPTPPMPVRDFGGTGRSSSGQAR